MIPYSYRVPYAVPYWGAETHAALLGAMLRGRLIDGPALERLSGKLSERIRVPGVLLYGTGRGAIEAGLRADGIGAGSEVILPSFCCASVLTPALAVGADPVFADSGPDLNVTRGTIEACLTERTRAVVVPHLFGNPAAIAEIVALCKPRGIRVVDDAAQALGATHEGRPLGAMGDWGILSFGNGKICMGTGGGVLISADAAFMERAGRVPRIRPRPSEAADRALATLVWRRWRRLTLPLRVAIDRTLQRGARPTVQQVDAPRNVDAAVALTLLTTLDRNLEARRRLGATYARELADVPRVRVIPHREGSAHLSQVLLVDPESSSDSLAIRVREALLGAGYEVTRSYKPLHLDRAGSERAETPRPTEVERVWRRLVELPCEPSVSPEDARRICEVIRRESRSAKGGHDDA